MKFQLKTLKKLKKTGFTVIEMLVVITVIGILASILLPAILSAQKKAKIARTQAMVDSITIALKQYRTDFGTYPPTSIPGVGGVSTAECVYYYSAAKFIAGGNSAMISAGPYMEYRQKDRSTTSAHNADMDGDGSRDDPLYEVYDSWGRALIYASPGAHNTNSFDLHSQGPDGDDATTDDIKNW